MKRVTLLARPASGGIRTHVIELLKRLPRDSWTINLAAPTDLLANLPPALPPFDAIACSVTAKPSLADLAAARIVARAVQQSGDDSPGIVHAHGIRAGFIAALANSGHRFPLVVTYHNIPPTSTLARFIVRFIESRSSASIAVSAAIGARVSPSATVIPNGIDLAQYGSLDREAARALYGLAEGEITVVCAARLSREKGIRYFISAAATVPDATFLVAGDGPERGTLTDMIAKLGARNVRLLGRIDSVPTLLAAADIACVPSLTEGQGIFALEAMAAGVAVVASNVGGLPEMIEKGSGTGWLVPPANDVTLAAAIRFLIRSPQLRAEIGLAAKARAREIGDIDVMVKRVEAVYDEVLALK